MFKLAFVLFAMASLSACASVGQFHAGPAPSMHASFDAAPMEEVVFATLHRRAFSAPSQRQPELRAILATSTDRGRRRQARLSRYCTARLRLRL